MSAFSPTVEAALLSQFRSRPFVFTDIFTGIRASEIRYHPDIPFAHPDNIALKLNLYRPAKVGKYPAIVTIYGEAFLGGTPAELSTLYQQASPLNAVKPNLPPSLLIYGKRDHIVQSKYGRTLVQTLAAQGNAVVLMEIPWADHAFDAVFSGVSNQLALYYTERFLAWSLNIPSSMSPS